MNLKEELHELAKANNMDYFGVAPVHRFHNIPAGHKPCDLLPKAKSVIVLGMRIPAGAIEANNRAYEGLRHAIFSYVAFGYNKVNENLDNAALHVVLHIEKKHRNKAYPIPAGGPRDEYLMMSTMSNRYAAVCAGLGLFGWSGFVLTQQDGPRVRWVSIITEANLKPDPLYKGPPLCDRSQCDICIQACPVGALSDHEAVKVEIEEHRSEYSTRNKPLCRCATTGLVKGTPGRLQADVPTNLRRAEEWLSLSKKDNPWRRMEFSRGNYCHRCLIECPVGQIPASSEGGL